MIVLVYIKGKRPQIHPTTHWSIHSFIHSSFIHYHAYVHSGSKCHRAEIREHLCKVGSLILSVFSGVNSNQ